MLFLSCNLICFKHGPPSTSRNITRTWFSTTSTLSPITKSNNKSPNKSKPQIKENHLTLNSPITWVRASNRSLRWRVWSIWTTKNLTSIHSHWLLFVPCWPHWGTVTYCLRRPWSSYCGSTRWTRIQWLTNACRCFRIWMRIIDSLNRAFWKSSCCLNNSTTHSSSTTTIWKAKNLQNGKVKSLTISLR